MYNTNASNGSKNRSPHFGGFFFWLCKTKKPVDASLLVGLDGFWLYRKISVLLNSINADANFKSNLLSGILLELQYMNEAFQDLGLLANCIKLAIEIGNADVGNCHGLSIFLNSITHTQGLSFQDCSPLMDCHNSIKAV